MKINYRQLQAQRTKDRILTAAIQLFKKNGFNNVGIEEITTAAEVSRGSFYVYYKNKEDLLAAYLHSLDSNYEEYYQTVLCSPENQTKTALEKLNLYMKYSMWNLGNCGQDLLRVYYAYLTRETDTWATKDRNYFPILERLIRLGQEEGSIRQDVSAEYIESISLCLTRGLTLEWCANPAPVALESKFGVIDIFCDMIKARQ